MHQNPVKAKIVKSVDKYKWSSFNDYLGNSEITDTEYITLLIDGESFIKYNYEDSEEEYEIGSEERKMISM